ncbi:hypothetical protein BC830DRAFT_581426 [Chytriomyces sp. MP71]|nr:hypothetical protein BC830DRAFT_581426 [Chytriomyces sp. MP71]
MVGLAPNGGGGYVPEEVVDLREVRELKRRCWGRGFVGEFDRVEGDGVAGVWFRKRWMCPLHVDHVLPGQREFREGVAIVDAETGKTVDGSDALREKSGHVVIVNEVDENEVLAGLGKEKGTSIPRNRHSQGSSLPAMMRPHVKVRVKGDPIALRVKSRDTNHKTKVIVVVFPMKRTPFRVSLPPGMPQPRVFAMASGTANKKASAKSNVGIGDVMAGDGRAGRRRSTVGMPGLATTLENAPLAQSSNKSMDVVTVAKVECVNGDATVTIPAVMAPLKSLAVPSLLNSMEPNVVLNIGEPSSQHTLDTHIQSASAPSRQTAEVLVPVHEPQVDADLAATATTSVPIAPSNDENEMDWETKTQPAEQTEPLPPAFVTKPLTLPTGVGSGANASTSTASPSPTVKKKRGRPPHIYRCEVEGCGKSFGQTWHLKRHANIHSESPMFYCLLKEKCDKVFLSQYHLDRHMKSHNNKKAVPPELPAGTLPRPLQLPQMPLVEPSLTEFAFVESDPAANGVMESSAVEGELTEEDSWALLSAGSSYVTDPRHIIVKGKYFCLYSGCGKDLSNQWSFDRHWKNQHYDTKDYSLCDLPGPVSQYKPKPKTKPKPPRAITGGESGAIGSPSSAANSRRSNISFATARKPSGPAGPKYKFPATVDQVACVVPGRATESGKYLIPDVTFRIDFNGAVSFSEGFLDYVDESQWEDVVNGTEGRRETVSVMLEAAGCVEEVAKRTIVEQEVGCFCC